MNRPFDNCRATRWWLGVSTARHNGDDQAENDNCNTPTSARGHERVTYWQMHRL